MLQGATSATVTVEPAGLVFNDILEYSLTVSSQFPWQRPPNAPVDEEQFLGASLAGGSTLLSVASGNIGVGFESPWPGDNFYFLVNPPNPSPEVTEILGMLGYGRYKITIDNLVFYLNTTDGAWNWAFFSQVPNAGDIQLWVREDGVFLEPEGKPEIQVQQDDEFNVWDLFGYNRNRTFTTWVTSGQTWNFAFNGNAIPTAGTPSSVTQFLLDVNADFKQSTTVNSGKTLQVRSFYNPNSSNWEQTVLKFDQSVSLTVNGTLDAQGTASQPIIFDRSGTSGTWDGIQFSSGSSGTVDFASIKNATKGVKVSSANNVTISNSTFENFTEQAIYASNSSLTVDNCTIQNPSGASHGIYLLGSGTPAITNNTIDGISIGIERKDSPGNATISHCVRSKNKTGLSLSTNERR